jgi:CBS domain-containing protein
MIGPEVSTVQSHAAPTVTPGTPVSEAAAALRDASTSVLVVLDDGAVAGIVTESDFVALVAETCEQVSIETIAREPPATLTPTTSISAAADRLAEARMRCLPVVENGVYSGIVSVRSIAPYVSRHRTDIEPDRERLEVESADAPGTPVKQ